MRISLLGVTWLCAAGLLARPDITAAHTLARSSEIETMQRQLKDAGCYTEACMDGPRLARKKFSGLGTRFGAVMYSAC